MCIPVAIPYELTLSRRRPISYRNQSIDLLCKSMDWFLYHIALRRERIKHLTRPRLGFSHLGYHKFKHGFLDAIDSLCRCSTLIGNTVHYFLHCPNFSSARKTFLNEIASTDKTKTKLFKLSFMAIQLILSVIKN